MFPSTSTSSFCKMVFRFRAAVDQNEPWLLLMYAAKRSFWHCCELAAIEATSATTASSATTISSATAASSDTACCAGELIEVASRLLFCYSGDLGKMTLDGGFWRTATTLMRHPAASSSSVSALENLGSGRGRNSPVRLQANSTSNILDLGMIDTVGLGTWCRREAPAWWIIRLLPCLPLQRVDASQCWYIMVSVG